MPGYIAHVGMTAQCQHAGQISVVTGNTQVLVDGQPVATLSDQYPIAGCTFTLPGPTSSPCVTVQWQTPAQKVFVGGQPVILQSSSGICKSAAHALQGPPAITRTQTRVTGM